MKTSISSFLILLILIVSCNSQPQKEDAPDHLVNEKVEMEVDTGATDYVPDSVIADGYQFEFVPISKEEFISVSQSSYVFYHCQDEEAGCYVQLEETSLAKDSSLVKHNDDSLVFQIENGSKVVLIDHPQDDDQYLQHWYSGQIDSCGLYVVSRGMYEYADYLLIDKKTGTQCVLWGEPRISGDCKTILSYSYDLTAGYLMNGLQIIKFDQGKFVTIYQQEFKEWGPADVYWKGEEIFIKKATPDNELGKDSVKYVKLLLSKK